MPTVSGKQSPLRVLLVDDEVAFTEVLAKRLVRRRLEVTVAHSGTDAIQRLRRLDVHVIVLDLKLGDMDGIEVLKVLVKMVPEVPVVMLTGHGSEAAAEEGIRQGAADYLTKPCDFEELLARIIRLGRTGGNAHGTDSRPVGG